MTTIQTARRLAKSNGMTFEEALSEQERRQRDIDIGGCARAFGVPSYEKDSLMTFEKAEWLKEEGRLNNV